MRTLKSWRLACRNLERVKYGNARMPIQTVSAISFSTYVEISGSMPSHHSRTTKMYAKEIKNFPLMGVTPDQTCYKNLQIHLTRQKILFKTSPGKNSYAKEKCRDILTQVLASSFMSPNIILITPARSFSGPSC